MVEMKILKEKLELITGLVSYAKSLFFVITFINLGGYLFGKLEFTIILSLLIAGFFWLWALDTQVDRLQKVLISKKNY